MFMTNNKQLHLSEISGASETPAAQFFLQISVRYLFWSSYFEFF